MTSIKQTSQTQLAVVNRRSFSPRTTGMIPISTSPPLTLNNIDDQGVE